MTPTEPTLDLPSIIQIALAIATALPLIIAGALLKSPSATPERVKPWYRAALTLAIATAAYSAARGGVLLLQGDTPNGLPTLLVSLAATGLIVWLTTKTWNFGEGE